MERTLSTNEAKIILDLEWHGRRTVTLGRIREMLGSSQAYARYLAFRLVKKGWLERLRPGLFHLVPADRGREGVADTNPLAAGAVLVDPYFYSFGTACLHHGLTRQVFAEIYIASPHRRRPETVRDVRYVFVHVPEHRFSGFNETTALGRQVCMATLERALLDAIDRPRYAGGIGEVSQIAAEACGKVSWKALVDLAHQWGSSALVQRLGYFFDLHGAGMPGKARSGLLDLVRPRSKILLGSRARWGTRGKLARPWNVIGNVPRDVLIARGHGPLRRVSFNREGRNK